MIHTAFSRLERYELKYHFPIGRLPELEGFLRPWCELDPASAGSRTGFYGVTSLYLDSPRHTLLRHGQVGMDGRFNMRIRAYGTNPEASRSWHMEIKEKACDQVTKSRGVLRAPTPELLWTETDQVLQAAVGDDRANLKRFLHKALTWNVHPILLTQYRRMAWFGLLEDYARITVDIGMCWREETGFDFSADHRDMRPSDLPERFVPGCDAVIELKCARDRIPVWMIELIRHFNLVRTGFSKFESAGVQFLRLPGGHRLARG